MKKERGGQGPRKSILWCSILLLRNEQAKIVIGADQASLSLGWAHQWGVCAKIWIEFWLMKISIYSRHNCTFFFYFSFIVVALTSSACASLTLLIIVHWSIVFTIHPSHFFIISSPFPSLLISFSHIFSNFYLNSKINSKLSLTLTSMCSIFTRAYSLALVFLLNSWPHYFNSLWI